MFRARACKLASSDRAFTSALSQDPCCDLVASSSRSLQTLGRGKKPRGQQQQPAWGELLGEARAKTRRRAKPKVYLRGACVTTYVLYNRQRVRLEFAGRLQTDPDRLSNHGGE